MSIVTFTFLFVFSYIRAFSAANCVCGESQSSGLQICDSKIKKRIAGGKEADVNEFPWAALLEITAGGTPLRCGGTLVNDRLV